MPLTTLDPTPALVVVDLQRGIAEIGAPGTAAVIEHSAALARAFRDRGFPVALVTVAGRAPGRTDEQRDAGPRPTPPEGWADLVPDLGAADTDVLVTKHRVGAFADTDLDAQLRQRGVTQVVVTGIATTAGVESTARAAYDLGYHVVFVTDAMTDRSRANHDHAVGEIFPRLGETTTVDDLLTAIAAIAG